MTVRAQSRKAAEWAQLIAEFEQGDVSVAEFCQARELKLGTFRMWMYRARKQSRAKSGKPSFSEVASVARRDPRGSGACTIRTGNVEVEFDTLPAPEYLAAILAGGPK